MERINQYSFYDLGQTFQKLSGRSGNIRPDEVLWDLFGARTSVKGLLDNKPIPIGVSRTAAHSILVAIDDISSEHFRGPEKPDGTRDFKFPADNDPAISDWRWNSLCRSISNFETIFGAEMREATTYFVPRRGIYWTPALVDSADESFPEHIRPMLPNKTREDWRAAGRCLAFNLLSASGFHVARAVEGALEAYYQLYSGMPGETLHSWHDYAKALGKIAEAKPTPAPAEKTLAELTQMKDDYRNPIMHPRVTLTESDAKMLFNNGESLIIAMAEEILAINKAGGVQPALAIAAPAQAAQGTAA